MSEHQYDAMKEQADTAIKERDFEAAAALYRQALENDPENSWLYVKLGGVYCHQEDWEQARTYCLLALEKQPDYWRAYHNLGVIHFHNQEYEKAISLFERALNIQPNVISWIVLGQVYTKRKEPEKAFESFKRALEVEPGNLDVFVEYATSLVVFQRYDEAIEKLLPVLGTLPYEQESNAHYVWVERTVVKKILNRRFRIGKKSWNACPIIWQE